MSAPTSIVMLPDPTTIEGGGVTSSALSDELSAPQERTRGSTKSKLHNLLFEKIIKTPVI